MEDEGVVIEDNELLCIKRVYLSVVTFIAMTQVTVVIPPMS